ncbi:MAG: hypothetical protein M1835_001527 [Candelina submexicana]|nr:MAG: hypothetical protein M1835_001527 [Candelina submexicana]
MSQTQSDGPDVADSPAKGVAASDHPPPAKRQLSEAQKQALAKARKKARATKQAKAAAKQKEQEEFQKFKAVAMRPEEPLKIPDAQPQDEQMTPSDEEESDDESQPTPPPSPIKKKKGKKHVKKKRKQEESSTEESSDEDAADVQRRVLDYNQLARAAYDSQLARAKTDVIYRQMFGYLNQ